MVQVVSFANGVMKFGPGDNKEGFELTEEQKAKAFGTSVSAPKPSVDQEVETEVDETAVDPLADIDSLSKDGLILLAKSHNVDLTGVSLKEDIKKAIISALSDSSEPQE